MNAGRTLKERNVTRFAKVLSFTLALLCVTSFGSAQILDTNFTPEVGVPSAIAIQPDGRVLATGWGFSTRLYTNGGFDASLTRAYLNPSALLVQPDGQIVFGGEHDSTQNDFALLWRINPSGPETPISVGIHRPIYAMALQEDGKILAAGYPTHLTNRIERINPDGSLDSAFNGFASFTVFNLTMQTDGKILVGGFFALLNGQSRPAIGRLHPDGSLDTNFNVGTINGSVQAMLVQPDGKILIGGYFTELNGQTRNRIARLNPNGTLDSFNPSGVSGGGNNVTSFALQANGKILVGGDFTTLAGQACTNLGRLNPDGSFDASFGGSASFANGMALQPNGSLLVASPFSGPGGQIIPFARFINTDSATNSLTRAGSTLTWFRGGSVPEVWRTTFEASTNGGASWLFLGSGIHITGGWQLTNVSLPANATVRARGYYTTGRFNASSSIAETIIGPPSIVTHPLPLSGYAGESARFFGAAGGTEPISYQWLRNGTSFTDTGDIIGTRAQSLTLSNIFAGRDQAEYSFVASNSFGSVTSQVVSLTVYEPVILSYTVDRHRISPGQTATFSVTAAGTPPLSYQWSKDGTNVPGATQSTLVISNAQFSDTGNYDVTVSNAYGVSGSGWSSLIVSFAAPDSLVTISNWNNSWNDYGAINCVVPLPDGRLLAGGDFWSLGGHACTNLALINLDGSVDTSFNPNPVRSEWPPGFVNNLAVQPDGKILVRGNFDIIGGLARTNLARLNSDGTVDPTFNATISIQPGPLAVQPDGKIVLTDFRDGTNFLLRLNTNGTFDPSLVAQVLDINGSESVSTLVLTEDGKILVGGWFNQIAGQPRNNFARFNADGTLDSWSLDTFTTPPFAVQRDGKILIARHFDPWPSLALTRLNTNGTVDPDFSPIELASSSYTLALQADGKILIGVYNSLRRFNSDGSEDLTFNVSLDGFIYRLHLAADGKVLIQGTFTSVNDEPRPGFCRLFNDPAARTLNPGISNVTWLRHGSCPEISRTMFEYSTNGSTWISLGEGVRTDGGWQASSAGLPANSTVRVRGVVHGSGSQWLLEDTTPVGVSLFPTANPFALQIRAAPGQPVVVEASTNLANWSAIHTNPPAVTNWIQFTDPNAGLFPLRFYRAYLP